MTDIDWPDGAIGAIARHLLFVTRVETLDEANHEYFQGEDVTGQTYRLSKSRAELIRRPQPWNGDGPPPAGTECETPYDCEWVPVRVIGHDEDRVVFRWKAGPDKGRYGSCSGWSRFRPLRTAEQLAAEAREAAVTAACRRIDDAVEKWNVSLDCSAAMRAAVEALYDAGLFK